MKNLRLSALTILTTLACFSLPASAQQFTVTNLGNLTGYSFPSPHSINNLGQVAGGTTTSDFSTTRAFRTAPNSPINPATDDLGIPSGATSDSATSINDLGQVGVTASGYSDFSTHAFRLDPGNATLIPLGVRSVVGGFINSANVNGINASGQVTGAATATPVVGCFGIFSSRAFRTAGNGSVGSSDDLGTLDQNCRSSVGFAINASGQVVGNSAQGSIFSPVTHAFLASPNATMQDLGTLGGVNSTAWSINDQGQIAGDSVYTGAANNFTTHAFFKDVTGSLQDLGTLGGSSSTAQHINNEGQIVGSSLTTGDTASHAFLYQNGTMIDLNGVIPTGSGWVLQGASWINDVGQIVGGGTLNGVRAAFRLDPGGSAGVNILLSELSGGSLPLTASEVNSLSTKLQSALVSLDKNNANATSGKLGAFVNQVKALVNSGRLAPDTASGLIAEATNVINGL